MPWEGMGKTIHQVPQSFNPHTRREEKARCTEHDKHVKKKFLKHTRHLYYIDIETLHCRAETQDQFCQSDWASLPNKQMKEYRH